MRITNITVTVGRKINLGDYHQAHLELSMTAELDQYDDATAAREQLWNDARGSLREQTAPFLKKRHEQVTGVYDGLPTDVQEQLR